MSGEIEVACAVQRSIFKSGYHDSWPENTHCNVLSELEISAYPHGVRITRNNNSRRYTITFLKLNPCIGGLHHASTPRYITFDQMYRLKDMNADEQESEFYSCLSVELRYATLEFFKSKKFDLTYLTKRCDPKLYRITLSMIYYEIKHNLDRIFTWLCISTIHLRNVPKDVRKLICNLI